MTQGSSPPVTPIHEILSPEEIARIRSGFVEAGAHLAAYIDQQFGKLHPAAMPFYAHLSAQFYGYDAPLGRPAVAMSERDRERCIITLLAAQRSTGLPLAVHFYWGLAAGLEPQEIADTLLLVAAYAGIDAYTVSIGLFARTLGALKRVAMAGVVLPLDAVASLRGL